MHCSLIALNIVPGAHVIAIHTPLSQMMYEDDCSGTDFLEPSVHPRSVADIAADCGCGYDEDVVVDGDWVDADVVS